MGRMILKYPWIFSTSIQANLNEILLLFKMEKVNYFELRWSINCGLLVSSTKSNLILLLSKRDWENF